MQIPRFVSLPETITEGREGFSLKNLSLHISSLKTETHLPGVCDWVSGHTGSRCPGLDSHLKYLPFQELHLQAGRNQSFREGGN